MNISKEEFTKLAKKHLLALESCKMDENGNKPIELFGIDKLYEAINYTCCCTQLNDKEEQEFQKWVTLQGYVRRMHGYCLNYPDNVHITDLRKNYRNEISCN